MLNIPESVKNQINNPQPDIKQFVDIITGREKPQKVHLAELFADWEVMQWITEDIIGRKWVPENKSDIEQMKQHLLCQIEYWYRMGYDYIRIAGGLEFVDTTTAADEVGENLGKEKRNWADMHGGPIQSFEDFEKYPWPVVKDENLWMYEFVAENLPDGMGLMACPSSGFLEVPMEMLIGYESMAMMIYDNPELIKAVFDKHRGLMLDVYKKVVGIEQLAGFFQGDDMGYKTGTMFSPDFLKEYSLPGHKLAAALAHEHDKIYILHSCGQLNEIYDYLIDEIKIDAKHSYEDVIMPVEDFCAEYGSRVAAIGGVDLNLLSMADEKTVRERVRKILAACMPSGRYALGSGNSVTNYCKQENILAMFDEAYSWG